MSKLDEIIHEHASECVDSELIENTQQRLENNQQIDKDSKQQIKDLFLELINDSMPKGSYHVNTGELQQKVKDL